MKKIVIITGGTGSERAVSLRSAEAVKKALTLGGYECEVFDFPQDLERFLAAPKPTFAFVMIHGQDGEDGKIPAMLELLGIPSQWADFTTHALCIDKIRTKAVWRSAGIPVANDMVCFVKEHDTHSFVTKIEEDIGFPCVIKIPHEGSSNGVYILDSRADLESVWPQLWGYDGPLLIEQFIEGREFTVSILELPDGNTIALPIIEIIPPEGEGFDYDNKYNGKTREICPAEISPDLADTLSKICLKAYRLLRVQGYGRIDVMVTPTNDVRLLELNTIPGFTDQSLFPLAAKTYGLSFVQLLEVLMETGIRNFKNRQ